MRMRLAAAWLLALPLAARADGLGKLDFPVTCNADARGHFLRGVLALHSFFYDEALDEFTAATSADGKCAMGYWGQAMAHHESLWLYQDTTAGRAALAKTAPLLPGLTDKERAWLDAAGLLFGKDGDPDDRPARVRAYRDALRRMHERWPDDDEMAAFYSVALMGAVQPDEKGLHARMEAGAIALALFQKNPDHPGAAHYVIHAFDDPDHAVLALPAARRYAQIAPEAHHARHMPAHIFTQLGMWDDAAASNESSWAASVAWVERRHKGMDHADYHSLEWLIAIYLQQGRAGKAREMLATMAKQVSGAAVHMAPLYVWRAVRFVEATGRWDELDALLAPAEAAMPRLDAEAKAQAAAAHQGHKVGGGYDAPAALRLRSALAEVRARQAARSGDARRFAAALAAVRAAWAKLPAPPSRMADVRKLGHEEVELLLASELLTKQGKAAEAIAKLKKAAELDARLEADGSASPGRIPAQETLGDACLAAGRFAEARDAYRAALEATPGRSRSLLGVARAADKLGDAAGAAELWAQLLANWHAADPDFPGLEEARAHAPRAGSAAQ
jgi:tetratricopeptide (TPR) repeat protein